MLDLWSITETGGWQPRGYAIASALMLALQAAAAGAVLLQPRSAIKPADYRLAISSTPSGRSTL